MNDRDGELRLFSRGLLSKWGFNDGDEPDSFLDYCDERGLEYPTDWHDTLRTLVRVHLLPVIDQTVEVYDIETIHNPIRAVSVDGREVDEYGANHEITLTPAWVSVPFDEAARIAGLRVRP